MADLHPTLTDTPRSPRSSSAAPSSPPSRGPARTPRSPHPPGPARRPRRPRQARRLRTRLRLRHRRRRPPLTYPHVLGFPLAMRLMSCRAFPLPLLGLVHTSVEITRHSAVPATGDHELTVYVNELAPHRRGTEATVTTEMRAGGTGEGAGTVVWESRSTYLARHHRADARETGGTGGTGEADDVREARKSLPTVAEWRLAEDVGRRYGAASGDRNPIHLSPSPPASSASPAPSPTACGRPPGASPRTERPKRRTYAPSSGRRCCCREWWSTRRNAAVSSCGAATARTWTDSSDRCLYEPYEVREPYEGHEPYEVRAPVNATASTAAPPSAAQAPPTRSSSESPPPAWR